MNDRFKLIVIVIGCLVLFVGAFLFLVVVLRDRLGRPLTDADFGDEGDDDEEPDEEPDGEASEEETGDGEAGEEDSAPEADAEESGEDSSRFAQPDPEKTGEESLGEEDLESLFTELFEGKPQEEEAQVDFETESASDSDVFYIEDILDCERYLGRTPEECGAPKESVSEERKEILTEGRLFGAFAYGGLKLGAEEEIGVPITCGYYAISHEISYDDCKKNLRARYGKTISSGMQALGEDEEEETYYCAFETKGGVLWLSHTSDRDYINLNFVP